MSGEAKTPTKGPVLNQGNDLVRLRKAVEDLERKVEILGSGLPDQARTDKAIERIWEAISQLQQFRDEDNNQVATDMEKIATHQEEVLLQLDIVQRELQKGVSKGTLSKGSSVEEEEDLISFLGIEAPKSTWTIIAVVASLLVFAGGLYVMHKANKKKSSSVVI